MKILVVSHYYASHRGGIEIVAGNLAADLADEQEVIWAASDCDPLPEAPHGSLRYLPMRSTNVFERLSGLPFPIWGPGSLGRLWREVRRADVVHLHDFAYLGSWMSFVFAALCRRPVLITQHVGFIPYRSRVLRLLLAGMHATIGRVLLGRADQVVFISPVVRDYYGRFVRFRKPPVVILNGVDVDTFVAAAHGDREKARGVLGLDRARPVLLFVGRFVEKKGLHILEALARRLPDVSWLFAGWGPVDPRRWDLPNVRVIDDRRGAALVPLYHAADLLVLPSVGEGLPLVVQESMSCGTPVVVGQDTAAAVNAPASMVCGCPVDGPGAVDAWESVLRGLLGTRHERLTPESDIGEFARTNWSRARCAAGYTRLFTTIRRVVPLSSAFDKF
jgi:glycosyltransferase involved in cell wall biosynthesis